MEPNVPPIRIGGDSPPRLFTVIENEAEANRILDKILENEYAVVGVDTEAAVEMSRFGILCLLQVSTKFLKRFIIYLLYIWYKHTTYI